MMFLPHPRSPEDQAIAIGEDEAVFVHEDDTYVIVDDPSALPVHSWPFPFVRNAAPRKGKKATPPGAPPTVEPVTKPAPGPAQAARPAQRGLEFSVIDAGGLPRPFRSFSDAAGFAVGRAAATRKPALLEVWVMSREGPAERIEVQAKSLPRI
jgi:hypothetical protein